MVQIKDDESRAIGKKDFEDEVKSFLSYLCFAVTEHVYCSFQTFATKPRV